MALTAMDDCTTPLEDMKLQNANSYLEMVSSGLTGLGAAVETNPAYGINAWPPGSKPEPYKWTAPNGVTWTQVLLDGKWMYRSSKDGRMFISASNLYDLMRVPKNPESGLAIGPIPGERAPVDYWDELQRVNPLWLAFGAFGVLLVFDEFKKRGKK